MAKGESVDRVTYAIFYARVLIGDSVDSGPRDRSRPRRDLMLATRPRRLQGKTVWEHSPTGKKNRVFPRLNRGAPLSYHSVTVPLMLPEPNIPVGPSLANPPATWRLTCRFRASLKHKDDGKKKYIKPNSQRQDIIIKYWVSIGSIHREQG